MVPNILDKEKGHFVDINFIVQTHARTHTHTHTHTADRLQHLDHKFVTLDFNVVGKAGTGGSGDRADSGVQGKALVGYGVKAPIS